MQPEFSKDSDMGHSNFLNLTHSSMDFYFLCFPFYFYISNILNPVLCIYAILSMRVGPSRCVFP